VRAKPFWPNLTFILDPIAMSLNIPKQWPGGRIPGILQMKLEKAAKHETDENEKSEFRKWVEVADTYLDLKDRVKIDGKPLPLEKLDAIIAERKSESEPKRGFLCCAVVDWATEMVDERKKPKVSDTR
jgi:hypothetical protein